MYFFCNIAFSSLPVFLPTIINEMGYSSTQAQALCVPPYIFAFIVILLGTYLSDRFLSRSVPLIVLCLMGALGYFILATTGSLQASLDAALAGVERVEEAGDARWWEEMVPQSEWMKNEAVGVGLKYAAFFLAAGGVFGAVTLVLVWNLNNSESESGRGAGMAMLQAIGYVSQDPPLSREYETDSVQTMRTASRNEAIPEGRWTELRERDGNMFGVAGSRVCSCDGPAVAVEDEE